MKPLFIQGAVDLREAKRLISDHERFYEANPGIVNAKSAATYLMPRESNGYEGYLRFLVPPRENHVFGIVERASFLFFAAKSNPISNNFGLP